MSEDFQPLGGAASGAHHAGVAFPGNQTSLMSHGMTAQLMGDVLPMDDSLNAFTIRSHVLDVAERMEQELGEEQHCFIDGCQQDWNKLPAPDGPQTV